MKTIYRIENRYEVIGGYWLTVLSSLFLFILIDNFLLENFLNIKLFFLVIIYNIFHWGLWIRVVKN